MSKWEDIVKERLEAPDGTLPESAFAEFQALRNGIAPAPAAGRFPLVWALVPAVAAGLAAVLLLRQPGRPGEDLQLISPPAALVAAVSDSTETAVPESETVETPPPEEFRPRIAQSAAPESANPPAIPTTALPAVHPAEPETIETEEQAETPEVAGGNPVVTTVSPFIPEEAGGKTVRLKVGPAAGIVAGGGLLAAVAVPFINGARTMDHVPVIQGDKEIGYGGAPCVLTSKPKHALPLKAGLSVRIPVTERWSITTGLDYSLYASRYSYSGVGERLQRAHYLGIPVRLDWTLASGRWLDVYLGAGAEGDCCVVATVNGHRTRKDGFSFSLLGAGGVQFNISQRTGLYVEPSLSWTVPSDSRVLETWRSAQPLAFSIATGVRITLGDK